MSFLALSREHLSILPIGSEAAFNSLVLSVHPSHGLLKRPDFIMLRA